MLQNKIIYDDKVIKLGEITQDSEKTFKLSKWIENEKFNNTFVRIVHICTTGWLSVIDILYIISYHRR